MANSELSRKTLFLLIAFALQLTVTSSAWTAGFEAGGVTASGPAHIDIGDHVTAIGEDIIAAGLDSAAIGSNTQTANENTVVIGWNAN